MAISYTVLFPTGLKANEIHHIIAQEAIRQDFPINLALAIAKTESSLNPHAVGSKGEKGLFQIMHYNAPNANLFDPKENTRIAIQLLKKYQYLCRDMGPYWVICNNQGPYKRPLYPSKHPYFLKIQKEVYAIQNN